MSVLLKKSPFEGIDPKELAQQIASRQKCQFKLPLWFNTPGIYYPKKTNIEQCSSEITAAYKAEIVGGKSLLDLSGGYGVDSVFFSKKMQEVWHTEIDQELSEIAAYNFDQLGANNIKSYHADGITFLESNGQKYDWIYIDPSRRDASQNKVFRLSDCHPDVPVHLPLILSKTNNILIKTSPLLDISSGLSTLQFVMEIHVVAVNNEVKELLWVLQSGYSGAITMKTINFHKNDRQIFNFELGLEKSAALHLSAPLAFLYEPNGAIMKSGAFKLIGNQFSLKKLHEHTHLYTSDHLIDFPGRRFNIHKAFRYNRKEIKSLKLDKANISVRNFPETVAEIRKKFKIKDGGNTYLFFITNLDNNLEVLLCDKC